MTFGALFPFCKSKFPHRFTGDYRSKAQARTNFDHHD